MSLKCKVVLLFTICSTYKGIASSDEVVLVERNVTDSFRVGNDGCRNNASVCTSFAATCRPDTGLCFCNKNSPNFVNHIKKISREYYCAPNNAISYLIGGEYYVSVHDKRQLFLYCA